MSLIHPSADIGANVSIGENVVIEEGVTIGAFTGISHNVVIHSGVSIGRECDIRAGAVLGRKPRSSPMSLRKVISELPNLRVGDECIIGCHAVVYSGTSIGNKVMIGDLASIREQNNIKDFVIIGRLVMIEYETTIHEHVVIQTGSHITGNAEIEAGVFIGAEVSTCNDNAMAPTHVPLRGPHIKQGARIGSNATLLPGITIGAYAVVSAGTTVSRDVPDGKLLLTRAERYLLNVSTSRKLSG